MLTGETDVSEAFGVLDVVVAQDEDPPARACREVGGVPAVAPPELGVSQVAQADDRVVAPHVPAPRREEFAVHVPDVPERPLPGPDDSGVREVEVRPDPGRLGLDLDHGDILGGHHPRGVLDLEPGFGALLVPDRRVFPQVGRPQIPQLVRGHHVRDRPCSGAFRCCRVVIRRPRVRCSVRRTALDPVRSSALKTLEPSVGLVEALADEADRDDGARETIH